MLDISVLVAIPYLKPVRPMLKKFRSWVLDSGAFSVYNSGINVPIKEYIDACKEVLDSEHPPEEIFSLDVIGDWKASMANYDLIRRMGLKAIPTFHFGDPWHMLSTIAKEYDKIAVACRKNGEVPRHRFFEQCFARVWPKKIHGFAIGTESILLSLPFHSADSTSWFRTGKYGQSNLFGHKVHLKRGCRTIQLEHFINLERRVRDFWAFKKVAEGSEFTYRFAGINPWGINLISKQWGD